MCADDGEFAFLDLGSDLLIGEAEDRSDFLDGVPGRRCDSKGGE